MVEEHLPLEQAGFGQNRNCKDQVLGLTNPIETGFQQGLKTTAVFVDLNVVYNAA